jgi:predicted lactoylglutathione lyase
MNKVTNNLILELHVPDLLLAKDFYSKIGFSVAMDDKPNDTEQGYMSMIRKDEIGNTMINFYGGDERVYTQSYFKQFPKDTPKGFEVGIVIPVSNIDQLYKETTEKLQDYIVRGIEEKQDHDLRWKDFRMNDPFGFYIRVTELIDWGQI